MPLSKARDRERKRLQKIRLENAQFQPKIPLYNLLKHKPGDTVRYNGQIVTIPAVDADGNPMWDF